ncbi:hypothetical protein PG984_003369 [Apiospora sp. TS-2023a]
MQHNGTWTLKGFEDAWVRLSMDGVALDKCELVILYQGDPLPSIGNADLDKILSYIEFEKDRAKGQVAEYMGNIGCGPEGTGVQWWMRKTQSG